MTRFLSLVLVGCAAGRVIGDDTGDDSGIFRPKDSGGAHDTGHVQDNYPEDTGTAQQDTGTPQDSGSCGCDLSNSSACNGSNCGWDPMAMNSKCGYKLGQGQQGAACSQQNPECAAGYVCVTPANKCLHWCKKPNGACPQGSACTGAIQNPPIVCGITYNVCQ